MASRDTKLNIIIDAQNKSAAGFSSLKKQLDNTRVSVEGISSAMKGVGSAGAVAFGGLAFMTKGIIAAGVGFEQTNIAFETMLGSAEVAKKTLTDLSKFAQRTPFELPQLEEASKRLLAYGTSAEDLIPTLEMLGNISAGVGMDKLPQLILAFGQVKAATKLTGAELRQFSEAGVPLLGTLAAQLGKTEGEIIEMVSAGSIGFAEMQSALASLTTEGGKFNNLMEKQSTSLGGMWSNLKDQISLTARAMGTELLPTLKPIVEKMIEFAQTVQKFVQDNPELATKILLTGLALTGILAVLLPLGIALPGLIAGFNLLAVAFGFVTLATAPWLIAIGAVIALLVYMVKQGYITKDGLTAVWHGIGAVIQAVVNGIIAVVEGMINFVIDKVNMVIKLINSVIAAAKKAGIGNGMKKISLIEEASFGRVGDSNATAPMMSMMPTQSKVPTQSVINITGNTFLDKYGAQQVGDTLMSQLKLSNAL